MIDHEEGGASNFRVEAPEGCLVELTVDFGHGRVRTFGMKRGGDGGWNLRLHGISLGTRYRFRIDGRPVSEPDSIQNTTDGWAVISFAA
jgi:1,4-alpha-glucan branching enzyme